MITVKDLLNTKGDFVYSISPDEKVFDALQIMADKNIGALLVLEEGKLVGMMSERDYARRVILKGRFSKDTPVREIMASDVICVNPDQTPDGCMALMTEKHIRHLPVLEGNRIVGVISIGDVVKSIISSRDVRIDQLEHYIMGSI